MSLEVFRGQIRVNKRKTYFGLDYELTDEVGNLIDKYNQLEKEKQELIDYLREKKKEYIELYNKSCDIIDFDRYESLNILCEEILSKIEKE